jgi:hypothetical protein
MQAHDGAWERGPELKPMQLALVHNTRGRGRWFRLPPTVPPFSTRTYRIFSVVWIAAFLLALVGPAAGIYFRYSSPSNNSQLMLGSRAGFAVSPKDATRIRFTVGTHAREEGLRAGDHIVAIYGLKIPDVMPVTEQALAEHADDPGYIAMGNLLYGTDNSEVPLTVRGTDGQIRDIVVTTGEEHIDEAADSIGIGAKLLSFIDVLHVIFYPFLLWAAWILHRRNARDAVSSILSLAVLFTIGAEQPSSAFLANIGVPRGLNVAIFDLGNICLLAGILLFPHGALSWRRAALLSLLPLLLFVSGQVYQSLFVAFMIIAVLSLLRGLRQTNSDEQRQQIRWALFGISSYAVLRSLSIIADALKWSTGSFTQQLLVEMGAGISFALAVLLLQLGLLVALLRYHLYDAEVVISRTVSVAIVTLVISGGFAGVMEGIITGIQFIYPESDTSQTLAAMAGAIFAAGCIEPVRDRVRSWTERRFQKNLFLLRDDLPEVARDMRETASLREMLDEILIRVDRGVRAVRTAAIVNGSIFTARGIAIDEIEEWRSSQSALDYASDICEASDRVFPIRVPLVPSSDDEAPIGHLLVGPRPDGSIPSKAEQKTLAGVSEPIARAIRTVIKREERERAVAEMILANTRRIEELEALLAARPSFGPKRSPGTA